MATRSRNERKRKRQKLELSRAYRMIDFLIKQRDMARMVAASLETELKLRDARAANKVEITRIPDDTPTGTIDNVTNSNNTTSEP